MWWKLIPAFCFLGYLSSVLISFIAVFRCRLAHPGGPLTTNKAVALSKFLERKLQAPNGLASINPDLLELAVKNAKDTVNASNYSSLSLFFLVPSSCNIPSWIIATSLTLTCPGYAHGCDLLRFLPVL